MNKCMGPQGRLWRGGETRMVNPACPWEPVTHIFYLLPTPIPTILMASSLVTLSPQAFALTAPSTWNDAHTYLKLHICI